MKMWIALLVMAPCVFAHGDEKNCKEVSGGVVTNFLNEHGNVTYDTGTGNFIFTTLGTATGDLRGAVGVYIFSISGLGTPTVVANVHVHWVTEAGDTIFLEDAKANAFQVGHFPGVYATGDDSYTAKIIGGTGRFAGASGQLTHTGVLDTIQGKVVLRYQGEICFAQPQQ
jgi:hypothetical protein